MVKTMVKQVVPLQPMEDHGGAAIHPTAHRRPQTTAGGHAPKGAAACAVPTLEQVFGRTCILWREEPIESPFGSIRSRFAGRTCDLMGDPCWSSPFLKLSTSWKRPTLEQFVKNCSPWEGLTLEKFMKDCLP
ncbi:zinc finger and BTB domain-containing protein 5 [Grus japonensis]|uniref:Zinc finger and BTB domain-containing protein 5 n=1 Tax=Grus japonensis TaxID=30415 RepID=A0ABC9Y8B6_GRUJA